MLHRIANGGEILLCVRDHSFSAFAKFSEKLTFLTPWNTHVLLKIICLIYDYNNIMNGKTCFKNLLNQPELTLSVPTDQNPFKGQQLFKPGYPILLS